MFLKVRKGNASSDLIDPKPEYEDPKVVKQCNECKQEFGVFSGKHHCHGCGKLFCKIHCDLFLQLPDSFGYAPDTPVRVCQACFKKYSMTGSSL